MRGEGAGQDRIASLRSRYDSPDIYVCRGIKSSRSCHARPSRGLLMGSVSARKQRQPDKDNGKERGRNKEGGSC